MQAHSAAWDEAMTGSVQPVVQVDAYYDGQLVSPEGGLPGVSGTVTADGTRLIVTTGEVTATDPDGAITPTSWDSPLGCFGAELHVRAGIALPGGGVELMSLGWLRVDDYNTQEHYQPYPTTPVRADAYDGSAGAGVLDGSTGGQTVSGGDASGTYIDYRPPIMVPRGVQVPVSCSDRMSLLDDARFLAPEQPASLSSTLDEIRRLCLGIVPVGDLTGVTDGPISRSITYDESRTSAIQLLARGLGMQARVDPDGALTLKPLTPSGDPVWTVSVDLGQDLPVVPVAAFARRGDRAGLYNAVVSRSTDSLGRQLVGIATEDTGPLRYGGPFGRIPYFREAPLATTQSAVDADARSTLDRLISQRTVTIPLTVPWNPALEAGDVIAATIAHPDGTTRTLTGPVQTISWPLTPGMMQVGLAVPRADLWS